MLGFSRGFLVVLFSISTNNYTTMEGSSDEAVLKDTRDLTTFYCQTTMDFQNELKSSITNIINSVTDDTFIKIYKTCYQGFEKKDDIQVPSLSGSSAEAKKYRKQFNALVTDSITETINETLLTTMDDKFKELEELKQEQTDESFIWRPPGDAMKHMVPFDSVSKIEEKKELESYIEKERESINLLKARLIQKRLKAKELHDILQASFKNIENNLVLPVSNDDCIRDTRDDQN